MSLTMLTLIILTVSLSACAQLALKLGAMKLSVAPAMQSGAWDMAKEVSTSPFVILGLIIYATSVLLWLWVLSKVDLSVAYPYVGLSFIMTMIFGAYFLNEEVNTLRFVGTMLIVCGCVLVGRSA